MCQAALRGEKLPPGDVNAVSTIIQLCTLRGIRYHHGFATELRDTPGYPAFTRALNARAIMSNIIPVITHDAAVPYCIWYPDVASEDTYRELARCYPQMRYQVGRACAVAGYSSLYKELDLLPDISIAEEAQDSVIRSRRNGGEDNRGSADILQHIVEQPVRWQVMNDYTRGLETDKPLRARHGLNGDTAVVSTLQLKRSFDMLRKEFSRFENDNSRLRVPYSIDAELAPCYFNITEDWNIDEYTSCADDAIVTEPADRGAKRPASEAMQELLWSPLPIDLPWGDKDLLILMAAYHGDVDRYARLRRPLHVSMAERNCIVRGIYHNTPFARWCSLQPDMAGYSNAITARFIMSDDLSRIADGAEPGDDRGLPRQIWYPRPAAAATYRELARRKPAAIPAVARALVIANYQDIWDELLDSIEPYRELMKEADASPNKHYLESLRRICAQRGIDADALTNIYPDSVGEPFCSLQIESPSTVLVDSPRVDHVPWDYQGPEIYDGFSVNVSQVELFIAAPKEARPPSGFDTVDLEQLYYERRHQPPSEGDQSSGAYGGRGRGGYSRGRGGRGGGSGIAWGGRGGR